MILITGATGKLGSSIIAQLQRQLNLDQFVVTSSNEAGAAKLREKGFSTRIANFSDSKTLHQAFKGIDKVLLISTMDQNRFEQHKNVIDAAVAQQVKQLVYTSLAIKDIQTSNVKNLMMSHFQTENYLKASGITYTILRNTMYADALNQILGPSATYQDINLPGGTGRVPYVLRREMGEATANLLLQNGHENRTYDIIGSQLYGYAEVAEELSALTGNTIHYNDISDESFADKLQEVGFPDFAIYLHTGTIKDIKAMQYEIQSNILEQLLGRPTTNLRSFLKELFNLK